MRDEWKVVLKIGGVAALSAVLVALLEIAITFLPGGNASQETVLDWLELFQDNWFMGLRNLGLLNIFLTTLAILINFALYAAHRDTTYRPYAAFAVIFSFLGSGVFFAANRAFPMFALSHQYAAAVTDAQRAAIEAAGQAMLSVGQSHTAGTFLGFFLSEIAGMLISLVMLRGKVFSPITAYVGMFSFACFMVFELFSSFVTGLSVLTMGLAMLGGLLNMTWYVLMARRLFQLASS